MVPDPCNIFSRTCFSLRTAAPLLDLRDYDDGVRFVSFRHVGSSDARRIFVFTPLFEEGFFRIMKHLPLLNSCVEAFRGLGLLNLPSLYIFKVILVTFGVVGELQTKGSGYRFNPGDDLCTQRHRLTLSHAELSSTAVRYLNIPSEVKVSIYY